jgi:hypothetical protein
MNDRQQQEIDKIIKQLENSIKYYNNRITPITPDTLLIKIEMKQKFLTLLCSIDQLGDSKQHDDISIISQESECERLLDAFIAEIREEFSDQDWEYLDFIKDRVMASNCD